MRKHLPTITISIIIIGIIALGIYFSERDSTINKELAKLNVYSKEELSFLEEQGFLNDINSENLPSNKEQIISLLKSSDLIEQNLNSSNESFEVLATKLDDNTYQLAFKLENKSNESKEFYLIPISESSQTEFKEIKGVVKNGKVSWGNQGDWGYDIEKHKQELIPELAQAYDDIDNNGYTGKPIRLVLEANSTLLAQSKWQIRQESISTDLESVYLLVYGSAGGVKDELTILTVHSSPQKGENWEVEFTTRGTNDLRIIPNDQATIDDDEFIGLYCNGEERMPQILPGDIIFYPDWRCLSSEALAEEGNGIGKVIHYTKKAGRHTLKFQFGKQEAFAYNSSGLIDNLISYWKLDDNADNSTVADSHGSTNGDVVNDENNYSSEQTTTGKIGDAFTLDNTGVANDYIYFGDPDIVEGLSAMTVCVWAQTALTESPNRYLVSQENGNDTFYLSWDTGEDLRFFVRNVDQTGATAETVADPWEDEAWYFACGTYDSTLGSDNIKTYLNGVHDGSADLTGVTGSATADFIIGGRDGGGRLWSGKIDEIGIWSRALTSTEITELYNSGDGLAYPFGGPSTVSLKGSTIIIKGAELKIK